MGVALMVSVSMCDLELLEPLFDRNAEFLLLVDYQQSQVFELHVLAYQLVGAHDDVDLALGQVGEYLAGFLGRAGARQVLDAHGEVAQALAEGGVVLEGEHSRGHQHGHLLAVGGCLERRAYRDLGLAEAHVAAYQAVHGALAFHVGLDGPCRRELVGSVLVDKRCLQLLLHVRVGSEGMAPLLAALRIQAYQVAGYIFELALGAVFHAVPCARADAVEFGRHPLLAAVFGELVQGVDRYEDDVVVLIHELDHLLGTAGHVGAQQPGKLADAVVHMHHIVAHLELVELLERQGHLARARTVAAQSVLVEAVKYLVVGKHACLGRRVGEALVQRVPDGCEGNLVAAVLEYHAQALELARVVAQDTYAVALAEQTGEILGYEIEILVVQSLGAASEVECGVGSGHLGGGGECDAAPRLPGCRESPGIYHMRHRFGVKLARGNRVDGQLALGDRSHACRHIVGLPYGHRRLGDHEVEERLALRRGIDIGGDVHALQPALAQLGLHVKRADGVYLVAEEVEAVGQLAGVAEYVEDGAAHGKLSGFVHIVHLAESQLAQPHLQLGQVVG